MTIQARRERVATTLASAFRDGSWDPTMMAARGAYDLDAAPSEWMHQLAVRIVDAYPSPPNDSPRRLIAFVAAQLAEVSRSGESDDVLDWIEGDHGGSNGVAPRWRGPQIIVAVPIAMGPRPWPVPAINTRSDLEKFVNLRGGELDWYADVKSLERTVTAQNLRHYDYRWRPKQRGGNRLIEAPKQNLKAVQRKILHQLLDKIPPHESAHGFRRGRSIQSYAQPHVGRDMVIRLDLKSFFTSVPAGRVFGIFKTAGYAEDVAHLLTGLTTNATPAAVLANRPGEIDIGATTLENMWLRTPHLPQGAPTSPALANLAAYRLDVRLSALAATFDATYTRYADDLAISGRGLLAERSARFVEIATEILDDEGFPINQLKTRFQTQAGRQVLTGMVVNQHLNVHRRDYDRLKAILHDAVVNGPVSANRVANPEFRSHLEGRIGFVQATNPQRARKLWRLFDAVQWG